MKTFYELGLNYKVVRAISDMGFEETTPIQEKTIPLLLNGDDVIGQAQTGTGKTAAFGIPLVEKIESSDTAVKGLVITPTRELAVQVAEEINRLGQYKGVKALPVYGGQDIKRQLNALRRNPQIIVGTPGRLIDHLKRKTIKLNQVKITVIDEADEMLNMGFIEDVEEILKEVVSEHQTLLFSATMPLTIQKLAQKFMQNPHLISIKSQGVIVPEIKQKYIEIREKDKLDVLCRLIDIHSPDSAIIFGRTKRRVDELTEALSKKGYSADAIHGDLSQSKRDSVLRSFKNNNIDLLVATDVAARGLDIPDVSHVYNFDIPQGAEGYVHRIGRTGRAGKTGFALTLVTPRERGLLKIIEQNIQKKIKRNSIPTFNDAVEEQQKNVAEKLISIIEKGSHRKYKEMAEKLLDTVDSTSLVAATLKLLVKEPDQTSIILTPEPPAFKRKKISRPPKFNYNQGRHSHNRKSRNGIGK